MPTWTKRLARPDDEAFLDELYETTRLDEVLGWGFGRAEASAFLRDQAGLQRRSYALSYPRAVHEVLLADGAAVGRLIVNAATDSVMTVVDLAVLPRARGRGLATSALEGVIDDARRTRASVELNVDPHNPARRLYERLGFRAIAEDGARVRMTWRASW